MILPHSRKNAARVANANILYMYTDERVEILSYYFISIDKSLRCFYSISIFDIELIHLFPINVMTYPVWFLQLILRLFPYPLDTLFSLCALLCACPYLYAIISIICPSCCSLAFSPCHCSANDDEVVLKCPANSARSRCCGGICHLPRKRELESGFGGRTACHCHLLGMLVSRRLYTCNEK